MKETNKVTIKFDKLKEFIFNKKDFDKAPDGKLRKIGKCINKINIKKGE